MNSNIQEAKNNIARLEANIEAQKAQLLTL